MRAYRSPLRLFVFGIIGILLIVAAADVMFAHWVSTPPEDNEGVLTTRGQAQQRGDIIWGAALLGAGTLIFGGTVLELARRKPLVEVRDDGLVLAVGTNEREVVVPWSQIDSIGVRVITDPNDGGGRDELLVEVHNRSDLPEEMIGARWDDSILCVDAHDWSEPIEDVELAARGALDHFRRVESIGRMREPSVTWHAPMSTDSENLSHHRSTRESDVKDGGE